MNWINFFRPSKKKIIYFFFAIFPFASIISGFEITIHPLILVFLLYLLACLFGYQKNPKSNLAVLIKKLSFSISVLIGWFSSIQSSIIYAPLEYMAEQAERNRLFALKLAISVLLFLVISVISTIYSIIHESNSDKK